MVVALQKEKEKETKRKEKVSCRNKNQKSIIREREKRKKEEEKCKAKPTPLERSSKEKQEQRRRVVESLLPFPLLSPTHPTPTTNSYSLGTRYNRTPFLLPKDVDTKVLSSFSIQKLEHHILLLRYATLSNQLQHLLRRNRPIASFALLVDRLVAFAHQWIVDNEVSFDVRPMMRPRVIVAVLLSVTIFTHRADTLWLTRIEARRSDVARKVIHLRMRILMPLTMFTPRKLLSAIREFAMMHFSACLDLLPAVFVCVEVFFCSFVVVESNRFVRVGEAHVFADRPTFLGFGHFASLFGEGGARGGAVVEGGRGGSFVFDVGGVERIVEGCRGHR
jgi:hypothetical protein